jgi:hypothetical protein
MEYRSEIWAIMVEHMRRLVRIDTAMVMRRICGVRVKYRKSSQELLGRLGVEDVIEIMEAW